MLKYLLLLISRVCLIFLFASIKQFAYAHVEYYDLNQGYQISDLSTSGKQASLTQYSANPSVSGLSSLNTLSDRPLNDLTLWNSDYQVYTGVGVFANTQTSYASGFHNAHFYNDNSVDVNDVTDWGWGNGTWGNTVHTSPSGTGLLADTHKIDFFNFRLTEPSTVTITWNIDDGAGNYIDSGFSLYRGFTSYQAHDASSDPLNPTQGIGSGLHKIQDVLDTGSIYDAQGISSAYRNTLSNTAPYLGQFNAYDNWGDGNAAGNWSNVSFIIAVNNQIAKDGYSTDPSKTLESLTIFLQTGNYTIAASGALGAVNGHSSFQLSGLYGHLTFKAVAEASCRQ